MRNISRSRLLLLIGLLFVSQNQLFFKSSTTNAASAPIGFSWSMRERFGKPGKNSLFDLHWNDHSRKYDPDYVNPPAWTVDFDACGKVPAQSSLRWDVDGQPLTQTTCSFAHDFPQLKSYVVTLTATTPDGQSSTAQATVTVKDLLIVSIGDSFASGEGAPEFGLKKWIDRRCHRSSWSGPARAARMIEQDNPQTSVTFISFACTGATIDEGLLGIQKRRRFKVQPQLSEVFDAVGSRRIDALFISIGGNDISFSELVLWTIVLRHADTTAFVRRIADKGLENLPGKFTELTESQIWRENKDKVGEVFISEYPDIVHELPDQFCNKSLVFTKGKWLGTSTAESIWALSQVIIPLNTVIREKATEFGWNYVGGILSGFGGSANAPAHGFCAAEPWINILIASLHTQRGVRGTVHPNRDGHFWYAQRLRDALNAKGVNGEPNPSNPAPSVAAYNARRL